MGRPSGRGREDGRSFLEYLALGVLAAIILSGLTATGLSGRLGDGVTSTICHIAGGRHCGRQAGGTSAKAGKGDGDSPGDGHGTDPGRQHGKGHDKGKGHGKKDGGDCHGFVGCVLHYAGDYYSGVYSQAYDDGKDLVESIWHLPTTAKDFAGGVVDHYKSVYHDFLARWNRGEYAAAVGGVIGEYYSYGPRMIYHSIINDSVKHDWSHGHKARAVGRAVFEGFTWIIPGSEATKGGKAADLLKAGGEESKGAKAARKGEKAGRDGEKGKKPHARPPGDRYATQAGKDADAAEKAADRGDATGARAAARRAEQDAADSRTNARRLGCKVIAGRFAAPMGEQCGDAEKAERTAEKKAAEAKAKAWEATLKDPYSLAGADPKDVEAAIPDTWSKGPAKTGGGTKYVDPDHKGDQVIVEPGFPPRQGQKPNVHQGPYLKISKNGKIRRVPLKGNPDPGHRDP